MKALHVHHRNKVVGGYNWVTLVYTTHTHKKNQVISIPVNKDTFWAKILLFDETQTLSGEEGYEIRTSAGYKQLQKG